MTSGASSRRSAAGTVSLPDGGAVVTADDPGYDTARAAWNLAVDQRPDMVVMPNSARDAASAIGFASQYGMQVAPQGPGHNAAPLGSLAESVLVKTERMRDLRIDPDRRTARVGAGVTWGEVAQPAAEYGLAGLAGSSPNVGVTGYSLGGGLSLLGRRFGFAANSIEAVDLVTADGSLQHVDAQADPDLFWALRGGGGSFGVVTALEFGLVPVREVYAGILWWPFERGAEVLHAWRELTSAGLPDELTTIGRFLQLPDLPMVPEPVRGQSFAIIEIIFLGPAEQADRLLAPLRALGPIMDTVQAEPAMALDRLHMDPEQPVPFAGDGMMLASLPAAAVDELIRVVGPDANSPLLSVEVRHLGGELARPGPEAGALCSIDAQYAMYSVGVTPTPEAAVPVTDHLGLVRSAMAPWVASQTFGNFTETDCDPATLWTERSYGRLRQVKDRVDPSGLIRANHPIPV